MFNVVSLITRHILEMVVCINKKDLKGIFLIRFLDLGLLGIFAILNEHVCV